MVVKQKKRGCDILMSQPLIFEKKVLSVDAVNRPGVLIPQTQAGGLHGHSIELPNEKACYQL